MTRTLGLGLMEALAHGDVRVACFILIQERQGRDPARTLADGVIAAARREPRPAPALPTPSASPRPAYPSDDPGLRSLQAVENRLRDELAQEHAAVHAAVAADDGLGADAAEEDSPDLLNDESLRAAGASAIMDRAGCPDRGACQEGTDAAHDEAGAPVEPGHDKPAWRRRRGHAAPRSGLLVSEQQRRAVEAMLLLQSTAPDKPPTPRAGAP